MKYFTISTYLFFALIMFLLSGRNSRAVAQVGGDCPAPCGQTASGYYICTAWRTISVPYGTEQVCDNWAWENGCCSDCDGAGPQCCSAPVGLGTDCGGTEPGTTPGPQPTAPPGQDPRCGGGACGFAGCGCKYSV